MSTIEITSSVELNDIQKAIKLTLDEVYSQYFFKGTHSSVTFDHVGREIVINSTGEEHVKRISGILKKSISRLDIDRNLFSFEESTPASGGRFCRFVTIKEGLNRDESKQLIQYIKQLSKNAKPRSQNGTISIEGLSENEARDLTRNLSQSVRDIPFTITVHSGDQASG